MSRILWFLPLCLILQDRRSVPEPLQPAIRTDIVVPLEKEIGNSTVSSLENLLATQPTQFLQNCLDRYDREVHGYTVLFRKQERIRGKLQTLEKIQVEFREKPYSVVFNWKEGAGLASKVMYVEGENDNKMLARAIFTFKKDPEGAEATANSHYTIKQFGMKLALERTLASMRKAEANGTLHLKYLGHVRVPELHDRLCYKFIRTPYDPPENHGVNELIIYIDKELELQVGSVLRDSKGELISQYFFADVHLNPEYTKEQFTAKGF